jgi:hypothetical protein
MGLSYIDRIISPADKVEADLATRDRKRPYSWSRTIKDCRSAPTDNDGHGHHDLLSPIAAGQNGSRFAGVGQHAADLHTQVCARCRRRGMSVAVRSV